MPAESSKFPTIPQWIVEHGRGIGRRRAIFEDAQAAFASAVLNAETDYPSMLVTADGQQYAVIRMQPGVEFVTQRRFSGPL